MSIALKFIISTMKKQEPVMIGPGTDYGLYRKREADPKMQLPIAKGVEIKQLQLGGVDCEILTPARLHNDNIIFYVHGGGYVYGTAFTSRGYASVLADECGMRVVTITYRLAPEHKFPAGPEDCLSVYRQLLLDFPGRKITLVGDSAGGTFVLVLALMARDQGLPMPACIYAVSACTTLAEDLPSHTSNQGAMVVPYANIVELLKEVYLAPGEDPANPYVSPLLGDYAGFPPMKVFVDRDEVLFDDSDRLVEKLHKAGVSVEYEIAKGTFHAFPSIGRVCPESAKYLSEAATFILRNN